MTPLNRLQIAWRAAQDIGDGMLVNLGMGMPVAVADYLRPDADVFIHSENGVIGAVRWRRRPRRHRSGRRRQPAHHAPAGRLDSSNSSWSFAAIRGGHIDVAILGAFEVAANGDLANWDMRLPNKGRWSAARMDLAACARAVWVVMEHVTRKGAPRLLDTCTLPLTAVRCVKRVYTDLAVIDITPAGMVVREMLDGLSEAELRARTGAPLAFAPDCRPAEAPPAIALPAGDHP